MIITTQFKTTQCRILNGQRNTAERIVAIEGLRGFAMVLVFWGHFEGMFRDFLVPGSISDRFVSVFGIWGHRGVSFFFVITGYFVYSKFMEYETEYAAFVKKRLCRVVPLYWFMLVFYLAVSFVVPSESKLPSDAWRAVIYVGKNALFLQGFMGRPMMVVSWALTYLVLAYIGVPAVIVATGMRKWRPWQRVILIMTATGAWLSACRVYPILSPRPVMIAVGLLVYETLRTRSLLRRLSAFGEALAVCLFVMSLVAWYMMDHCVLALPYECRYLFLGVGLFAVCLYTFARDGVLKKWFEHPFLANMGRIGYSYYLSHGLSLKAVIRVMTAMKITSQLPSVFFWILLAFSFGVSVCTSMLLYRFVEAPLAQVLRRATAGLPLDYQKRPVGLLQSAG